MGKPGWARLGSPIPLISFSCPQSPGELQATLQPGEQLYSWWAAPKQGLVPPAKRCWAGLLLRLWPPTPKSHFRTCFSAALLVSPLCGWFPPPSYLLCSGSLSNVRAAPGAPCVPRKQGARGSYKRFCKPWLRGVGVFIARAAKNLGEPSQSVPWERVHSYTDPSNRAGRKKYGAMLGFSVVGQRKARQSQHLWLQPKLQQASVPWDSARSCPTEKEKNLILIPHLPPSPVLICHQPRAD